MKSPVKIALGTYFAFQVYLLATLKNDDVHFAPWILARPLAIVVCSIQYFRGKFAWALWLSIAAGSGVFRMLVAPPAGALGYVEGSTQLFLCVTAFIAWRSAQPQKDEANHLDKEGIFQPDFPIVPLFSTEEEATVILRRHGNVSIEDPESDRTIAQKLLVATNNETRISAGIWNGRVRFTNYRTELFNETDARKGQKLGWFVNYYGGANEFDKPMDTGFMIFWRNPNKKITVVFGLHAGPVRIIDQDPAHWPES